LLCASLVGGCNRRVTQAGGPRPRIVSFAPSITQIMVDMGLVDHIVGVTSQCELPADVQRPVVGDALSVNVEAILATHPDVLLVQTDPSRFAAVRKVAPGVRIEHFTIETLDDIASAIERIGRIVGRPDLGAERRRSFAVRLSAVRKRVIGLNRPRVMFVYGFKRPSTAGAGTFIDDMIVLAGGVNAAAERLSGWRNVDIEQIIAARPDVLICLTDEASRDEATEFWHRLEDLPAAKAGRVYVVTDRNWTIPSTRSALYAQQLARMIHAQDDREDGHGG